MEYKTIKDAQTKSNNSGVLWFVIILSAIFFVKLKK